VPDRVDASVNDMQPPSLNTVPDRASSNLQSAQLLDSDDAVLALGQLGDPPIHQLSRQLSPYGGVNCGYFACGVGIGPRIAGEGAPLGRNP
jgi:hypothetical protein